MEPTPRQREAIESWNRGDVCVVAGPGSGKTYVLVERFRWLVVEKKVPVHRILAITFTDKAAANMRRRLVEAFPASSPERKDIERAYISTIHAFCARLLRENAIEAAVDPEFRVLDEWEAGFELRRAVEETLEAEYLAHPERVRDFLSRFGSNDVHGSLLSLYEALRAAGESVAEVAQTSQPGDARERWLDLVGEFDRLAAMPTVGWNLKQQRALAKVLERGGHLAQLTGRPIGPEHFRALEEMGFNLIHFKLNSPQRQLLKHIKEDLIPTCRAALLLEFNAAAKLWLLEMLAQVDRRYRHSKRQAGTLDYADLEESAIRLLEKTDRRAAADFLFVLMDEFQDTNPLQARLVKLLRREGNFFAVGDINQSIYGFRQADPRVFHAYREETQQRGGHVVPLFESFRSRQEVLKAVTAIIADAEGVEPQELKAEAPFRARKVPFLEILAVYAEDAEEALKLEACHVAARIQELAGALELEHGPAGCGDFAILLRTSVQVRVFERALRERGIPCQVTEGRGFYEAREVNDLLHFLRLLLNPLDEISLAAVLRSPLAGITDETLLRARLSADTLIDGIGMAAGVPPDELEKLDRFRKLLDRYRRERDYLPIDRLLGRLLAETGYESWLLAQWAPGGSPHHKAANVRKLLALARRFHSTGLAGLQEFVERVDELRREEAREGEAEPPEQSPDAVQVMTVHAAKGLEFAVVILGAINRVPRRDYDPVCFLPSIGVGVLWRDPATGEAKPDAVAVQVVAERKANNLEETQRLFYVGMTRAEELLILSASFGGQIRVEQSAWAPNLGKNLGINWKNVDNQVRPVKLRGIAARVLQTNQKAPAYTPSLLEAAEPPGGVCLERATAEEQADTEVSASAVTLFALCPRKYYLSRYLGFDRPGRPAAEEDEAPPAEPDEMDSSEFGRHVHALLAGEVRREQGDREALRLVANFESSALGRRAAAARRIQREQGFLVSLNGRLLRGQMDLWFEEGSEIVLVDYKTDDITAAEAAARAADYELQLRLYALALEQVAGARPHRAILYFLRLNKAVEVSLDPAAMEVARAKVEELFQAQSRVAFPLRVGGHCRRCDYFGNICPARLTAAPPRQYAVAVE